MASQWGRRIPAIAPNNQPVKGKPMAKAKQKTVEMIRVTITGYIPSPGFNLEEFKKCDTKLRHLEAFAAEQLEESEFKSKKVNRHVPVKVEAPKTKAAAEIDADLQQEPFKGEEE